MIDKNSLDVAKKKEIRGPLTGIRVVDMASVLAGPVATQIFADYGADVIKIEAPQGDLMRLAASKRNPGMGPLYMHTNRNKRSVAIDVKHAAGRAAVLKLCQTADVFIHNIRPDAIARLNLTYEDVVQANPKIIYSHVVGYGTNGPYAGRPAYDDLIQGMSGMAGMYLLTGSNEPHMSPAALADRFTGLHAAHATIAALLYRERTGEGQSIEIPMYELMVQAILGDHMGGLSFEPPVGPPGYNRILSPNRRPYKTKDGYICVLASTDRQWIAFLTSIDRMDIWEEDPRFADGATRALHYNELYALLAELLMEKTASEWYQLLTKCDVPVAIVNRIEDLEFDPHIIATGLIQSHKHSTEGVVKLINPPQRFSKTPAGIYREAPNIGQQTVEVLSQAGFPNCEIAQLLKDRVIHQHGITIDDSFSTTDQILNSL